MKIVPEDQVFFSVFYFDIAWQSSNTSLLFINIDKKKNEEKKDGWQTVQLNIFFLIND